MPALRRGLPWKPWALVGTIVLACWFYAAPINVTNRLRNAVEKPHASALIASRVDFARVNAQLSDDLRRAASGGLNRESFSRLLLQGWLSRRGKVPEPGKSVLQTRLFHIRYKALNRFIAIYWDESQIHEVVLTLERRSLFHGWRVTKVSQFDVCAYDFDCALVPPGDPPAKTGDGHG